VALPVVNYMSSAIEQQCFAVDFSWPRENVEIRVWWIGYDLNVPVPAKSRH
jgi:hypothetical protein